MAQQSWRTRKTRQSYRPHYDSETDRTRDDEPTEAFETELAAIRTVGVNFRVIRSSDGQPVPQMLFNGYWSNLTAVEAFHVYCLKSEKLIHFLKKNCPKFLTSPEASNFPAFQNLLRLLKIKL